MGFSIGDIYEHMYEMAKGHIEIDGINMMWDMTDGLSKEEWSKRQERRDMMNGLETMILNNNGRVMMPDLGII